jgi:hypothetical protein
MWYNVYENVDFQLKGMMNMLSKIVTVLIWGMNGIYYLLLPFLYIIGFVSGILWKFIAWFIVVPFSVLLMQDHNKRAKWLQKILYISVKECDTT